MEKKALKLFKNRILKEFPRQVKSIQLFGSKARGDALKHSDIDVIVILDQVSFEDKKQISGIALDIMMETEVFLSVKKFTTEEMREMKKGRAPFWQTIEPDLIAL